MRQTPPSSSQINPSRQNKLTVKLLVMRDGELAQEHAFSSRGRRLLRLGRLPSSHVPLDDSSVAQCHAMIEIWHGQATLIDLGHTGGTRVNGERVGRRKLANHDQIELGGSRLAVVLEQGEEERPPDSRTRMFLQQLRLTPPEWIPELHRFLEYVTFRQRGGERAGRIKAPPVKGKPPRLALVEEFLAGAVSQPAAAEIVAGHAHGRAPSDAHAHAPAQADADAHGHTSAHAIAPARASSTALPPPDLVAAQLAETTGRAAKPWEPGSGYDDYDTRRLVTQLKRERRRIHWGALVGGALLVVGLSLSVWIGSQNTAAAAVAGLLSPVTDSPQAGTPAPAAQTPPAVTVPAALPPSGSPPTAAPNIPH